MIPIRFYSRTEMFTTRLSRRKLMNYIKEIISNRKLIANLSFNDFKTKYAGSFLGIVWAFIQPLITIFVYWFAFQVGLRSQDVGNFPFALWFMAGLIPWFFFSDGLNGGTNALIDYSYLVKKVVFNIDILPLVKVISAVFVHIFFIVFLLIMYALYGYYPDLYSLQILYYSLCLFLLVLGLSYITAPLVVFFRDLGQIVNIILQVGVWMTPILWNIDTMQVSDTIKKLLKLNPVYYVVQGYRDALINKAGFWEHPWLTLYFWLFTLLAFFIGTRLFKKLRLHFADVL